MLRNYSKKLLISVLILFYSISLYSADRTLGILQSTSESYEGYTLFCPLPSKTTYLIDHYGRIVNTWESDYDPNLGVYLLENGNLLKSFERTDESSGVEIISWDGTQTWEYDYSNGTDFYQHHDIEPLPNGNVLIVAAEYHSKAEAVQAGRDPNFMLRNYLYDEHIIEVEPTGPTTGNVVWKWSAWDHIVQNFDSGVDNFGVIADHPELIDINFNHRKADWLHINSIAYNPNFDQIVISSRPLHEIWVIDHSTTTSEAAGHTGGNYNKGGDFLYRWGNPLSYEAGDANDQKYFGQHDANWVKPGYPGEGNILVFNNGLDRVGAYSTVDEITPPVDESGNYETITPGVAYNPSDYAWSYNHDPIDGITSAHISSAKRLPNGNTLICKGDTGLFLEVKPDQEIVWEYQSPVATSSILNQGDPAPSVGIFKCEKLSPDYLGLDGRDLTPQGYIENNPIQFSGTQHFPDNPTSLDTVLVSSKINNSAGISTAELYVYFNSDSLTIQMYDDGTHNDPVAGDDIYVATIPPMPDNTFVEYYLFADNTFGTDFLDPPFATKDYNFSYTARSAVPNNINIEIISNTLSINWDAIAGISDYKIYSSEDPYTGFLEDSSGSLTGETWTTSISNAKKFYYVVAVVSK